MIDAYVIYNNPKSVDRIKNANCKINAFLHFIDDETLDGRKQAYKIKGSFAARLTPFIGLYENDKIIKGFYSEASDDIIEDFLKYEEEINGI